MEILSRVVKKSLFIGLPAVAVSLFFELERVPLGIAAGWFLGILNLRNLSRNVEGLIGSHKATARIVFLSITRLFALFAAVVILIYFKIVNPFGLLFGFTIVFALILFEGLMESRE
jgi:hypothetical protein